MCQDVRNLPYARWFARMCVEPIIHVYPSCKFMCYETRAPLLGIRKMN